MRFSGLFILALILFSCREEIGTTDESFIKIYGNEVSSYGERIITLGDKTVVLGKTGHVVFEEPQVTSEEVIPSFVMANSAGNAIHQRLYPVDAQYNTENRISFVDVLPLESGGYKLWGEWQTIEGHVNFITSLPFTYRIGENLNPVSFQSINNTIWDPVLRTDPVIYTLETGENYVLYRQTYLNSSDDPIYHTLQRLDDNGDVSWTHDYFELSAPYMSAAWDLADQGNGELYILNQYWNDIRINRVSASTGEYLGSLSLDPTVNIDRYEDPGSLVKLDDGYVAVYRKGENGDIFCQFVDEGFSKKNDGSKIISGNNAGPKEEVVKDAERTHDGNFVVLSMDREPTNPQITGWLRKVNLSGDVVWEHFLDGIPEDVEILADGSLLVLYNPIFNSQQRKMTMIKLRSDGTL